VDRLLALQESRRLFGDPSEDLGSSEPQVMIPTMLAGRRLSLTLGLLQGNDRPLIAKQVKRCVSIHGNIRQVLCCGPARAPAAIQS
jgi:hypothetical protein